MILTKIKDDEIINGYLGRLKTINVSMESIDEVKENLKLQFGKPDGSIVSVMANASNIPLPELIMRNTILPFRHAAVQESKYIHNEYHDHNITDKSCLRVLRSGAVLCEKCIEEDHIKYNYSYWKRFHQVSGVDWCPIHNLPLKISKNVSAYEAQPERSSLSAAYICSPEETSPLKTDVIYRYIQLTSVFLNIKNPVRARGIVLPIGAIAKSKLNIRISRTLKSKGTTLCDVAKASCSYSWLKRLFPRIDFIDQYEWFGPIDNCVTNIATAESFALALAIIFESTEEAITFMKNDLKVEL